MEVKIIRADGCVEFFETPQFMISRPEDMSPHILTLTVKDNRGKTIAKWKRPNIKEYLKTYVPEPDPFQGPVQDLPPEEAAAPAETSK